MALTPKQEAFAREYAIDKNATQAAIRAGLTLKSTGIGFYVYFLVDGRDGSIFYVGKGKRLWNHRRDARSPDAINPVKATRIRECGRHLREVVFADGLDEVSALRLEKHLIGRFADLGLTNVSGGTVHPNETALARIDRSIDAILPYDTWLAVASPRQLEAAAKLKGSTEQFYCHFVDAFLRLREKAVADLGRVAMNIEPTRAV